MSPGAPAPGRVCGPSRFRRLQASRLRARSGPFRASWAPNSSAELSVAFAIPTSVGCAVDRNLIRRRLRHAATLHGSVFPGGDVLIRVSAGVERCSWPVVHRSVGELAAELARLATPSSSAPPSLGLSLS